MDLIFDSFAKKATVSAHIEPHSWIQPHPMQFGVFYAFCLLNYSKNGQILIKRHLNLNWAPSKNLFQKIEPRGSIWADTVYCWKNWSYCTATNKVAEPIYSLKISSSAIPRGQYNVLFGGQGHGTVTKILTVFGTVRKLKLWSRFKMFLLINVWQKD